MPVCSRRVLGVVEGGDEEEGCRQVGADGCSWPRHKTWLVFHTPSRVQKENALWRPALAERSCDVSVISVLPGSSLFIITT